MTTISTTLDRLPLSLDARIVEVAGDDAVSMRLREMGILEGQSVRRLGTAPLGDPLICFVRGFRLALRRAEAARITVEFSQIDAKTESNPLTTSS